MPDGPEELDRDALVEAYFRPVRENKKNKKQPIPQPPPINDSDEDEDDVVQPPRLPALSPELQDRQQQAITAGLEELEAIREAFHEFQENIGDLVLFDYVHEEIEKFGEAMERYRVLITDEVNRDQLSDKGRKWYDALKRQRADILVALYRRMSKGI